ncbi:hypothetical protein ACIRSS_40485 [Amycolatopsis sp. NPDC101161]|uniref:phage tail protein n=1 Tax=Amycolatopsis sp. NPDC101161 TaxID=3363940 RepID=UPI00381704DC
MRRPPGKSPSSSKCARRLLASGSASSPRVWRWGGLCKEAASGLRGDAPVTSGSQRRDRPAGILLRADRRRRRMPPPLKALSPRPLVSPAVVPASPKARGVTEVARPVAGNAAVTAAMSGLPRGAVPTALPVPVRQDLVGNQAVAGQVSAGPRSPGTDPKFKALKKDVDTKKKAVGSSHPPAAAEAGAAQDAAEAPADDREARGKAAHAADMEAAQPKEFDKQAFVEAVKKAVADKAPKNLDEADNFSGSGKADEVKTEVQGKVGEGKDASAREIADTTAAPPKPAPDAKPVVPMAADKVPGKPGAPNPARAAPDPLPPEATDMSAGPDRVDRQMADAQVTEQQLTFEHSREPQFDKAVKDKKSLDAHSEAAPRKLRAGESRELEQVKNTAAAQGSVAMAGIHAARVSTGRRVGTGKQGTKITDEDKRKQVTALLQEVFDRTKGDVEKILADLDTKVDDQFTTQEKRARERFTVEHELGMRRYKAERYGGWDGPFLWARDLFLPLPDEANRVYVRARDNYLAAMDRIITEIAGTVETELKRAKDRIADGRKELKTAVDKLPADLKALGREAASDFDGKFDELKDTVNDKGTELVDTLATKYTEAVKSVDDEIAAEKEKNRGLLAKAADAIGGAVKAIIDLGRMLLDVLRKAASAIGAILKDPIGFLGNLVTGVGGGLKLFMRNAGRHLEAGVLAWLLGTAATAGLQLPTSFDVLGILMMIAALLGLSWANIRSRLARRVPDQALVAAETAVPLVAEVKRRGVAGLWDDLKTRVGDLKKTLIGDLVSYLLPTIIIAGVTWIVSLFNPASAFIRACKMIIDIIRFVVTNARQIIDFVNAVLDAVLAIARGGTGGVPALVERALARAIPVLIGALAALLGIGGIAGKVRQIFQKLARPVNRALDAVIKKMADLVKKLWAKLKPKKRPGKKQPDKNFDRILAAALRDAGALTRARLPVDKIRSRLPAIRARHKLRKLDLVVERVQGTRQLVHFEAAINPRQRGVTSSIPLGRKKVQEQYGILIRNQVKFQAFADEKNVVVDVRPTNPDSVRHLLLKGKARALYKPQAIKPKTINAADVLLRVKEAYLGLVGFFHTKPKIKAGLGEAEHAKADERREQREKETADHGEKMRAFARKPRGPGRYEVQERVVYGYDEKKRRRPLAGDHDLFSLHRPEGPELGQHEVDELVEDLRLRRAGVMHGTVVEWDTHDPVELRSRDDMIEQARMEGVVRFVPGGKRVLIVKPDVQL